MPGLARMVPALAVLAILSLSAVPTRIAAQSSDDLTAISARASTDNAQVDKQQYSTAQALAQFNSKSAAVTLAKNLAAHSWEYGTTSEALLEYYNPELSVFSTSAFPKGKVPSVSSPSNTQSLAYASQHIELTGNTLADGQGAAGDPASLGVSAWLLGNAQTSSKKKTHKKRLESTLHVPRAARASASSADYASAAERQLDTLLHDTPLYSNGAISQRVDVAELWADGVMMIHPFLAYSAVATNNATLLKQAVEQCQLYRDVLVFQSSNSKRSLEDASTVEKRRHPRRGSTPPYGVWEHIIGPQSQTKGLWATGNGWAALGIVRVLATVKHWSTSSGWTKEQAQLKGLLHEIFTGLAVVQFAPNGFYKNYVSGNVNDPTDSSQTWFGDGSGTAAIVAAALRYAVLDPSSAPWLISTTKTPRHALASAMAKSSHNSTLVPTVDPYNWFSTSPVYSGSPEGQAFLTMAISAWRDCVQAGVCSKSDF